MFLDFLRNLYDSELYDDVKLLISSYLSSQSFKDDPTYTTRYLIYCLHADSHFQTEDYHAAIKYFKSALQTRSLVKGRGKRGMELPSEANIKYKQYKCYMKLKLFTEALSVLQSIPVKAMTSTMKLALAQMIVKTNGEKPLALLLYMEVMSHQPLSLVAMKGYLSLGGKTDDVLKVVEAQVLPLPNLNTWITTWVKAQSLAEVYKDYGRAADILYNMSTNSVTVNTHVMSQAAYMYFIVGNYEKAKDLFRWVREISPHQFNHLDSYAFILYYDTPRCPLLETLTSKSLNFPETAVEPWIINGYHNLSFNKPNKAVFFAQKALLLDTQNFEALLLAGLSLTSLSEHTEALVHLRLAIQTYPHRFEPYICVTEIYWKTDRRSEARAVALDYQKNYPSSRSHTLHASILMKEGTLNYEMAQMLLRKAILLDGENMDALELLARVLQSLQGNEEAIEFLIEHAPKKQVSRYHKLLASIYLKVRGKKDKALDHIIVAKRLEPSTASWKQGSPLKFFFQEDASDGEMEQLARIGKVGDGEKVDESFLDEVE